MENLDEKKYWVLKTQNTENDFDEDLHKKRRTAIEKIMGKGVLNREEARGLEGITEDHLSRLGESDLVIKAEKESSRVSIGQYLKEHITSISVLVLDAIKTDEQALAA